MPQITENSPANQRRLLGLAGAMGFLMYGLGYCVPLAKRDFHVSRATASIHNLVFASLLLLSSYYLSRIITRYTPSKVMRSGWVVVICGVAIFTSAPNIWISIPGYGLCALGATLFNNTNAGTLSQGKGSSLTLMLRAAGIGTAGGACAPLLIGTLVGKGVSWRITLFLITAIVAALGYWLVPEVPDRSPTTAQGKVKFDRQLKLLLVLGFTANMLEVGAGAWALDLMTQRSIANASALIFASFFSYGIATSRLSFSVLTRLGAGKIWLISAAIAGLGLAMIVITRSGPLTVVGLIVAAIGIGPLGGIAVALAADSPRGADLGISANVMGAAIAIGIGPWLVGVISDSLGFAYAYSMTFMILLICSVLFVILLREFEPYERR
ncbi:MAG: MFS transporter [Actinomycetes bacterium]